MTKYTSITDVAIQVRTDLCGTVNKKSVMLLYAFNATGKTRLSVEFDILNDNEEDKIKVLSYNAFLEDLFIWDNADFILRFYTNDWRMQLVRNQGLENVIAKNFKMLTNSKIDPSFDFKESDNKNNEPKGEVTFEIASGDNRNEDNIKISKSEESMLVWAIFHSVLEIAIEALNTKEDNRTTDKFNDLEYIIIDDPISSIDDTGIIAMAVGLFETVQISQNNEINFLITTHHALFYNVLFNFIRNLRGSEAKKFIYILSKSDNLLELDTQDNDTPFAYHLLVRDKIKEAIDNNNIEKYHFNLFRVLLEKTANFLGYKNFKDCIVSGKRKQFIKVLHLNSHGKLSELENSNVSNADKELFKETFNEFIKEFKWKI